MLLEHEEVIARLPSHLRLDIPVTVAVDEDLDRARETLLGLVRDTPDYMSAPEPKVIVKQLNANNVELELRAWVRDERRHIDLCAELNEAVFKALTRAGIDMPFETFRVEPITVQQATAS